MMRNRSTRARKRRRLKSKTLKYRTVMSSGGHLPDRVDPNSIAGAQFVSDFDSLYSVDATAAITRDEIDYYRFVAPETELDQFSRSWP